MTAVDLPPFLVWRRCNKTYTSNGEEYQTRRSNEARGKESALEKRRDEKMREAKEALCEALHLMDEVDRR